MQSPRASEAAPTWWSRPSCRCAVIPPRTFCCARRFSTPCAAELAALASEVRGVTALIGFPEAREGRRHNAMAVIRDGRVAQVYRKACLPNYTVFDEERYFEPGTAPCVFEVGGVRVATIICEDVWFPGPAARAKAAGAQVIVVPNGSPYHTRQQALRREQVSARARENGVPIVYVNRVGGQDELVFDGASFVVDRIGRAWCSSFPPGTKRSRSPNSTPPSRGRARRARRASGDARVRGAGDGRA